MPTKKKRQKIIPDNLPAILNEEEVVPSIFTGNKLAQEDPERYAKVVQELGEGKPLTRIARGNKVSPSTVMAIAKRESKSIDAVQNLTQGLTSYATQSCLMRIIDKLDKDEIPAGVLPIAFGILRDKEKNDLGQATSIVEHKKVQTIDEVQKELDAMRDAEVIDVTDNSNNSEKTVN